MRVVIYDRKPGTGLQQWGLMVSWMLGCFFQRLFGPVDAYYGATSWEDALKWLLSLPKPISSIQYWGHGSPGKVWLNQKLVTPAEMMALKPKLAETALIWFRACSTFQGKAGYEFSAAVANGLNCTVAGHTRIIGPLQGGLHTRKPNTDPSWPLDEGELPPSKWPTALRWGNNTITCLGTRIPNGW